MDISFTIDNFLWINSSALIFAKIRPNSLRFAKIRPNSTVEFNFNFIHQLMAVSSAININHRINILHHTMARTKKTIRTKGVDGTWVFKDQYTDNDVTNLIDASVNAKHDDANGTSVRENGNDSNADDNSLSSGDEEASRLTDNDSDDDGNDKNTGGSKQRDGRERKG
jgi:hypothetical protein